MPISVQQCRMVDSSLCRPSAIKRSKRRVIILLTNRIKLVIVASSTRHRESKKRLRHDIDLVVGPLNPVFPRVDRLIAMLDQPEMSSADDRLIQSILKIETRPR